MNKTNQKLNTFDTLSRVDVNAYTKKRGQFNYLTWSHAWAEVKKRFPSATYTYYVHPETNQPYSFEEGVGGFCHTSVTIEGETLKMWLPILNFNNKTVLKPNAFDINSCLMRCLTKNLAMFGLGFYIYMDESLPNEENLVDVKLKPSVKKTTEVKKEKEVTLLVDKWDEALLKYIEFRDAGFDPDKIVESLRKKYEVANEEELNNFLADANKKSK